MEKLKIEIGPGKSKIDSSWITVGPYPDKHIDIVARWGEDILPFEDNSVDLVYASHVLEHIWWYKTVSALKDVYRILKSSGRVEIHVPNFAVISEAYKNKKCGDNWFKYNPKKNYMCWVNGRLFTYGGPGNTHRAAFDRNYMEECLIDAGFDEVEYKAPIRGSDHGNINLPMTGIKAGR